MGNTFDMAKFLALSLLCLALSAAAFAAPNELEDEPRSTHVSVEADDEPREDELGLGDDVDEDDDDFDVAGELDRANDEDDIDKEHLEPTDRKRGCPRWLCKSNSGRGTRVTANLNLGGVRYTGTLKKSSSSSSRCSRLRGN